jgi:DNA-binding FadR family transcriptional regulator
MPKEPTEHRATVAQRIIDYIARDGLAAGDPMPSEPHLVAELHVSRNSVREALRSLQAIGIVDIRHGYGTFVGNAKLDAARHSLVFRARTNAASKWQLLRDLTETREVLETHFIAETVQKANDGQIAKLRSLAAQMADDPTGAIDRLFHETLYSTITNTLTIEIVRLFWDTYHDLHDTLSEPHGDMVRIHLDIVDAIERRDAESARAAVARHFEDVRSRTTA